MRSCSRDGSRICRRPALAAPTALAVLSLVGAAGGEGCRVKEEAITGPFTDSFDRPELGAAWRDTGGNYGIAEGQLVAARAYNHPAWLRKRLPHDVSLELDAQSNSSAGDIKIELFGDGESFDPDKGSYLSTGYMLIFGGWNNSLSVICRNNEHDEGRKASRTDRPVERGRTYHWSITRRGGAIDWRIDGAPFLAWTDPEPLGGPGHEYLGVNDWEAEVRFDNLVIRPAP